MPERDRKAFDANLADEMQRREDLRQRRQQIHEWLQFAARFLLVGNAGGAVATVSFIGVTIGRSDSWVILPALALFAIGTILPGIAAIARAHRLWSDLEPTPLLRNQQLKTAADLLSGRIGGLFIGSLITFILGIVAGISALSVIGS